MSHARFAALREQLVPDPAVTSALYARIHELSGEPGGREKAERPPRKRTWPLAAGACAAAVLAAVFLLPFLSPSSGGTVSGPAEDGNFGEGSGESSGEIAVLIPWEELPLSSQYTTLRLNGTVYTTCGSSLSPSQLGEKLGEWAVTGYDEEERAHTRTCPVYALQGLSEEAVVAVRLNDTTLCAYLSDSYTPATLGDWIRDLNLRETLTFGLVYDTPARLGENSACYRLTDSGFVWEALLAAEAAPFAADLLEDPMAYKQVGQEVLTFSVSVPVLGQENVALTVTENGYLRSNVGQTEKLFFLGREATEELRRRVRETGIPQEWAPVNDGGTAAESSATESSATETSSAESSSAESFAVSQDGEPLPG
ncbi:MAG: hypothetical protein ACI4LH_06865 [Candidatus Heritagella sp.]